MNTSLSIIICTYNPQEFIFSSCLQGISNACDQLKPKEIIIIDNNSNNGFAKAEYVQKFIEETHAKIVVEHKQGLTPARLRGIEESTGDILLFIDDDNFIPVDFFKVGIRVAGENNHIGAWSGQVRLHFEEQPEAWTEKYWGMLVCRSLERDVWSNFPHLGETMPCGAGLFVRRSVAIQYLSLHKQGKRGIQLDRTGKSLFSGGDNDLAACACDLNLGVGLFKDLYLLHYIPRSRVCLSYLLKLAEGIAASAIIFRSFRGEMPKKQNLKNHLANTLRFLIKSGRERSFYLAVMRGEAMGKRMLLENNMHKISEKN